MPARNHGSEIPLPMRTGKNDMPARTPPRRNPKFRRSFSPLFTARSSSVRFMGSIQLEFFPPVGIVVQRLLQGLVEQIPAQDQTVHVRAHEAKIGVPWRAHDRFPANVEGGGDYRAAAVLFVELGDHPVIKRIGLRMHGL